MLKSQFLSVHADVKAKTICKKTMKTKIIKYTGNNKTTLYNRATKICQNYIIKNIMQLCSNVMVYIAYMISFTKIFTRVIKFGLATFFAEDNIVCIEIFAYADKIEVINSYCRYLRLLM